MPDVVEKRSKWRFLVQGSAWSWAVVRPEGQEEQSQQPFKTLLDCTENAKTHGYVVWYSADRRKGSGSPADRRI
jgi:hypothetical protein